MWLAGSTGQTKEKRRTAISPNQKGGCEKRRSVPIRIP
jgi:hypothetical protein